MTPVTDSVAKVDNEIAVGEDLTFQRSWWRFERAAWTAFTLIIALDIAGVFGRGPVANARLRSADASLDIRYERIERTGTPSMMSVSLGRAGNGPDRSVQLFVSDDLVGPLGMQRIIPQPSSTRIGNGGLTYTFPIAASPAVIRFELQPVGAGIYPFRVSLPGMASLSGRILVVP